MNDWQSLLAEHGTAVWRTVFRMLCDHADALDCYQETFIAAWRLAEREAIADWRALLVSLATRRAVDRLRERIRARACFTPLGAALEPATSVDCPVAHARAAELMALVREGMSQLPDKQAEVFWLSCVEGHSHQQISVHLQVAPGEVRVLLHRARVRLARVLESKLLEERKRP